MRLINYFRGVGKCRTHIPHTGVPDIRRASHDQHEVVGRAEDFEFPMANKPALWPFICRKSGLAPDARRISPIQEKDVRLPPAEVHPD
jgi:hypothetical protein